MKQFACGTVIDGCPGIVKAETQGEVLALAAAHAAEAHGMSDLSPEVEAAVRAGIVDAG